MRTAHLRPVVRDVKRLATPLGAGVLAPLVLFCALAFAAAAQALTNPERHYEMVSPVFKGGVGATIIEAVAENGEAVAFYSNGSFAGAPSGPAKPDYLATRDATGWTTAPLVVPASIAPEPGSPVDFTPELTSMIRETTLGPNREEASAHSPTKELLLHDTRLPDTSANFQQAGPLLTSLDGKQSLISMTGASTNLCHLILTPKSPVGALLPEAQGLEAQGLNAGPYEVTTGCDGTQPSLRLVGLNDQGQLINRSCAEVALGADNDGALTLQEIAFNAVSADGEEVFFNGCVSQSSKTSSGHQLFVRLAGTRTLEVSRPISSSDSCVEASACSEAGERASAQFDGASRDGARVFFTTAAQLVPGDTDTSVNLYLATIGCPADREGCGISEKAVTSMTRISVPADSRESADVQGVVRVAPDGSRVYFVARGDLLTADQRLALEAQGGEVPRAGADNLYVYNVSVGTTEFIGYLCSGPEASGLQTDSHCPPTGANDETLWLGSEPEAQTAGADGRFLVFSTYAQLSANDTDTSKDVYRYDASTGVLERVSLGEAGYDANGNAGSFDAQITPSLLGGAVFEEYGLDSRVVSEDGSRIAFTTSAPLSPAAGNGLRNVYEWRQGPGGGEVSLISSGSASEPVGENVVMSPSGRDIFFDTTQGLVPQDTDGAPDVYDARLGSGFAPPPAPLQPCAGDACQGPLTNPAPTLIPGSVFQAPGENLSPSITPANRLRAKPKCAKGKKPARGKCIKSKSRRKTKATKSDTRHTSTNRRGL
jgi:hypothetical protein